MSGYAALGLIEKAVNYGYKLLNNYRQVLIRTSRDVDFYVSLAMIVTVVSNIDFWKVYDINFNMNQYYAVIFHNWKYDVG